MSIFWKVFVTFSAIAGIFGFMAPWVSIEMPPLMQQAVPVNGIDLTAYDLVRTSDMAMQLGPIGTLVSEKAHFSKTMLLLIPLLGVFTLTVNSLRGHAAIYALAALVVLGFHIYTVVHFYDDIQSALTVAKQTSDVLSKPLAILNLPTAGLQPKMNLGYGFYVAIGSVLGILVGSIVELLSGRKKPARATS